MLRLRRCGVTARLLGAVTMAVIGIAPSAAAQTNDQTTQPDPPAETRRADFLFGRPNGSLGIRGNWVFARAGSDLFDFVTRELTIDRNDFNSAGFGADAAFTMKPRVDLVAGFDFNKASVNSEYREFVDNNFLPITQFTALKTVGIHGGIRVALTPRGHDVSRYAWVPRRVVPFVGAGAGVIFYEFTQQGDFVDFVDLSVFTDFFRSKGWGPSAHGYGGVDVQIFRALYGTFEGRYVWSSGELGRDFVDFDPIDLSGFRVSGGLNLLF